MKILVKLLVLAVLTLALLVTGFALGYPIGKHEGIETGTEWAMLQAKLAAREAGVIMPVYFEEGTCHVVLRPAPAVCKDREVRAVVDDGPAESVTVPPAAEIIETASSVAAAPDPAQGVSH